MSGTAQSGYAEDRDSEGKEPIEEMKHGFINNDLFYCNWNNTRDSSYLHGDL